MRGFSFGNALPGCSGARGTTYLLTCKDFLNELGEYLDDRLDPDIRARLHQHVTECPNCWVILDTTQKTIKVYKGLEPQSIPAICIRG